MANKKFYVDIDLQNNKLDNATIGANSQIASLAGSFQYDSVTGRLQYYDGVNSTTQDVANLNDVVGLLNFKGGYDAATNIPDLTTPAPGAVEKGDFWVVTAVGTFFGEAVEIGDSLIAATDNPTFLTDWVRVQSNVDLATTTVPGITYLATQAQVDTGTEATAYAVTPATLQTKIDDQSLVVTIPSWSGSAGNYSYAITHNLAADGVLVSFVDGSGDAADFAYTVDTINQITVKSNSNPAGIVVSIARAKT